MNIFILFSIWVFGYCFIQDIQSLPILKSDHNCVHEIDRQGGYLKSARCQEQHMFRPFSKSDSGAVTINTQTLTYVRMTSGTKSPGKPYHLIGYNTEIQLKVNAV